MLPNQPAQPTASATTPARPAPEKTPKQSQKPSGWGRKKPKKRKGLGRKMFEELWDVVEDILD
jgi:hypothetical protein